MCVCVWRSDWKFRKVEADKVAYIEAQVCAPVTSWCSCCFVCVRLLDAWGALNCVCVCVRHGRCPLLCAEPEAGVCTSGGACQHGVAGEAAKGHRSGGGAQVMHTHNHLFLVQSLTHFSLYSTLVSASPPVAPPLFSLSPDSLLDISRCVSHCKAAQNASPSPTLCLVSGHVATGSATVPICAGEVAAVADEPELPAAVTRNTTEWRHSSVRNLRLAFALTPTGLTLASWFQVATVDSATPWASYLGVSGRNECYFAATHWG